MNSERREPDYLYSEKQVADKSSYRAADSSTSVPI